jgi:flagellar motor switch protein FliM
MTDDFPNPQRTSPQQLRWLRILHEGVARDFGTALGALLRTAVEVRLADIDRRTYGEFLDSLVLPACFHVLKAAPVDDRLLLDIEPSILHPMIDYLLGGKGDRHLSPSAHAPSGIELRLTARMVNLFLEEVCRAWKDTIDLKLDVLQVESNPRQLRVLPTDEAVVQVGFELSIGDQRGMMRLCLPCRAIGRMSKRSASEHLAAQDNAVPDVVELSVTLAETRIAGDQLDDLRLGDIITTETASDSPAIVSIEGQSRFRAQPRVYQGRKAICIIEPIESEPSP